MFFHAITQLQPWVNFCISMLVCKKIAENSSLVWKLMIILTRKLQSYNPFSDRWSLMHRKPVTHCTAKVIRSIQKVKGAAAEIFWEASASWSSQELWFEKLLICIWGKFRHLTFFQITALETATDWLKCSKPKNRLVWMDGPLNATLLISSQPQQCFAHFHSTLKIDHYCVEAHWQADPFWMEWS